MSAGSDFRADFYMAVDVSDGTNTATVNVRVEYDGAEWKAVEGQVMAGRHSVTASTTDNATVGTDIGEEIVMESGAGTDFLAAAAGSDNYLMMAGSTDGDTTTILETTTAQNIRDAFYNETSVAIDDEDSIQLREQFNIHDVSFERIASGRGINQNTLEITSTNYDGSVDTFELANQYSSFTTSQVEYLVLGQGWEGNGEVYKLHVDGDLSDSVMHGTAESDILSHLTTMTAFTWAVVLVITCLSVRMALSISKLAMAMTLLRILTLQMAIPFSHSVRLLMRMQVTSVLTVTAMLLRMVRMLSMYLPMARH